MRPQTQEGPSDVQAWIGFFAILWQALSSRARYLWRSHREHATFGALIESALPLALSSRARYLWIGGEYPGTPCPEVSQPDRGARGFDPVTGRSVLRTLPGMCAKLKARIVGNYMGRGATCAVGFNPRLAVPTNTRVASRRMTPLLPCGFIPPQAALREAIHQCDFRHGARRSAHGLEPEAPATLRLPNGHFNSLRWHQSFPQT
jgi:hypothetical protein